MKKTYKTVVQVGREFHPYKDEAETNTKLAPGAYTWHWDPNFKVGHFQAFKPTHDQILDLPSPEYTKVTQEMEFFLRPETKAKFQQTGFIYKRSALLHGKPGTGKTVIIQRVIKQVIEKDGIVLFITNPRFVKQAFAVLDDLQPETTVLVIFEEIDGMIRDFTDTPFLSLLDGEIQKQNVMYLAATNYIDRIPGRLLRPGRFSSVIEVNYPTADARRAYFKSKLGNFKEINEWVDKTINLSVDELKEVVQSVYIFNNNLEEVVSRILKTKGMKVAEEKVKNKLVPLTIPESIKMQFADTDDLSSDDSSYDEAANS